MTETRPLLLSMSASGRYVALRRPGAVEVVDVQGTAPRRTFALDGGDFVISGATLCLLEDELRCVRLDGSRREGRLALAGATRLAAFHGRGADAVLAGDAVVALDGEPTVIARRGEAARWFPLHGRAVLAVTGSRIAIATPSRVAPIDVPLPGAIRGAAPLLCGRSIGVLAADDHGDLALVVLATGQLVHRIRVPVSRWHAFAADRGHLLLGTGDAEVVSVDLRYGRVAARGTAPHAVSELAVDADGRSVAIAGPSGSEVPLVSVMRVDELLRATAPVEPADSPGVDAPTAAAAAPHAAHGARPLAPPPERDPDPVPADEAIPALLPLALGEPRRSVARSPSSAAPFATAGEHLAALLDLVTERAAAAIADAWHSGRISADGPDHLPFEPEVLALAGGGASLAPDRVVAAHDRLRASAAELAERAAATLAVGAEPPFVALARDLALSAVATQVLLAVLGPRVRPEIARLYRILANETGRPVCDDALVAQLLAGDDPRLRDELADELTGDAPLLRFGAIVRGPRGGLDIDDAVLARLRDHRPRPSPATAFRTADRALADLVVDRAILRRLVLELAAPRGADAPVRIVIRGRRGSGRHAVIAALAHLVDHAVAAIDAAQLPRAALPDALRRELARARLSRAVPVVSGLELRDGPDHDVEQLVRQVLRQHPGPIVLRTSPEAQVPIDPDRIEVELPALTETQRRAALAAALAGSGADAELLARRYRIGPGTIARIAGEAGRRLARAGGDPTQVVDQLARQHVASRLGGSAHRIHKLADWDQVALPDDMLDSLRELVGRVRHGRTVFEDWGYEDRITTARGLTALFYGPPGTGKTMVAGLIARELGLELYRVDLAKVVSKWVGETEKNLGEVFDAAEDGQLMLLFDEADSLFARRSDVKSSNDRYANLEVNYLLQRLDSFEGIAILTTNLEGTIDPAFKRRLSMRLYFPFPDEDMRTRLWASHVTAGVPTAGELDYAALARRFPLSGGYIRNSALRAAFLAAQEQTPLCQSHLERAVLLEYRELGKLAEDGRME